MGDDGIVHIHRAPQIAQHAIGVERGCIAIRLMRPGCQPFLVQRSNFLGNRRAAARLFDARGQIRNQPIHGEPRITDKADINRNIFAEVVRVERRVNDLLAAWHFHAEIGFREGTPNPKNHISIIQEMPHAAPHGQAAGTKRKRVIFREGRFAAKAGRNRRRQHFSQSLQLRPGARPMHAGAGVNHGALRFCQHGRSAFQINRIRAITRGRHRVIGQRFRHFLIPHIGRDFDQHGTASAIA